MRILEFSKRKRRPQTLDIGEPYQSESLEALNQRSLILFNQFSRRMDRLEQYLSEELPKMVDAYEQWRVISDRCEEMETMADLSLAEASRDAIRRIDRSMQFWISFVKRNIKNRKVVSE